MKEQQRLRDMLAAVEAIEAYAVSDYEQFVSDGKIKTSAQASLLLQRFLTEKRPGLYPVITSPALAGGNLNV